MSQYLIIEINTDHLDQIERDTNYPHDFSYVLGEIARNFSNIPLLERYMYDRAVRIIGRRGERLDYDNFRDGNWLERAPNFNPRIKDNKTYKILRYFQDGRLPEPGPLGLTLAEAQAHCRRADTKGSGWFDGYTEEK